ncbi:MAG TPA: exodeoxyribonuclease VII small subunit [Candidatus Eremiobacteraceae bacterium]|jgi:exodeoxyribonuclease VII small subunit|nr:exodeoxyribonuclease VII small subunit [Candidatus Eremiobacteraceae bacterium]
MAKTAAKKTHETEGPQPDFEAALSRLEEIVEKLDDGNLPLAQSLALFKEGTALAKRCRNLLAQAELAVKEALGEVRSSEEDDFHEEEGEFEDGA